MTAKHTFDVRDYGAKGDGESDDTKSIQAALDAAAPAHGTVFVPEGVYSCSELRMAKGTGLQGLPTWSYRDSRGSVLRLNDGKVKCLLNLTGAIGATVQGLCLHGAGLKGENPIHGILVDKADYGPEEDTPRIDSCRIEKFSGDGIRLERIWCFSVRHNQCYGNQGCGMRVRGWDGFVLDNWFSGNGMAGYGTYEENNATTITGNRIEWNMHGGILIHGGSHYNITGNYIDRSGRDGIALLPRVGGGKSHVISVTGNVIYRSGRPEWLKDYEGEIAHARFEDVQGLVFSGNTMTAGLDDGSKGNWSPDNSLILHKLEDSIVKDNVMHLGSLKRLVVDRGEHGPNVIIKDNVGSLKKI